MGAFAVWHCNRCKADHMSYCPRLWGRFNFYRQFIGEAPLTWIIKQIATPRE